MNAPAPIDTVHNTAKDNLALIKKGADAWNTHVQTQRDLQGPGWKPEICLDEATIDAAQADIQIIDGKKYWVLDGYDFSYAKFRTQASEKKFNGIIFKNCSFDYTNAEFFGNGNEYFHNPDESTFHLTFIDCHARQADFSVTPLKYNIACRFENTQKEPLSDYCELRLRTSDRKTYHTASYDFQHADLTFATVGAAFHDRARFDGCLMLGTKLDVPSLIHFKHCIFNKDTTLPAKCSERLGLKDAEILLSNDLHFKMQSARIARMALEAMHYDVPHGSDWIDYSNLNQKIEAVKAWQAEILKRSMREEESGKQGIRTPQEAEYHYKEAQKSYTEYVRDIVLYTGQSEDDKKDLFRHIGQVEKWGGADIPTLGGYISQTTALFIGNKPWNKHDRTLSSFHHALEKVSRLAEDGYPAFIIEAVRRGVSHAFVHYLSGSDTLTLEGLAEAKKVMPLVAPECLKSFRNKLAGAIHLASPVSKTFSDEVLGKLVDDLINPDASLNEKKLALAYLNAPQHISYQSGGKPLPAIITKEEYEAKRKPSEPPKRFSQAREKIASAVKSIWRKDDQPEVTGRPIEHYRVIGDYVIVTYSYNYVLPARDRIDPAWAERLGDALNYASLSAKEKTEHTLRAERDREAAAQRTQLDRQVAAEIAAIQTRNRPDPIDLRLRDDFNGDPHDMLYPVESGTHHPLLNTSRKRIAEIAAHPEKQEEEIRWKFIEQFVASELANISLKPRSLLNLLLPMENYNLPLSDIEVLLGTPVRGKPFAERDKDVLRDMRLLRAAEHWATEHDDPSVRTASRNLIIGREPWTKERIQRAFDEDQPDEKKVAALTQIAMAAGWYQESDARKAGNSR